VLAARARFDPVLPARLQALEYLVAGARTGISQVVTHTITLRVIPRRAPRVEMMRQVRGRLPRLRRAVKSGSILEQSTHTSKIVDAYLDKGQGLLGKEARLSAALTIMSAPTQTACATM
jgi:hypothetical protein